jgi:hypothetical protein
LFCSEKKKVEEKKEEKKVEEKKVEEKKVEEKKVEEKKAEPKKPEPAKKEQEKVMTFRKHSNALSGSSKFKITQYQHHYQHKNNVDFIIHCI